MDTIETKHITIRIPSYVVNYCKKNNISYKEMIMKGFDKFRETDEKHAISRLEYHEDRVLHWKHIVLQKESECNTKNHICNTIKEQFKKHGRGSKETKRQDMNWVQAKAKSMIDQGVILTPHELYDFCIGD